MLQSIYYLKHILWYIYDADMIWDAMIKQKGPNQTTIHTTSISQIVFTCYAEYEFHYLEEVLKIFKFLYYLWITFIFLNIETSVASVPAFGVLVVCCLQIRGTKLGWDKLWNLSISIFSRDVLGFVFNAHICLSSGSQCLIYSIQWERDDGLRWFFFFFSSSLQD